MSMAKMAGICMARPGLKKSAAAGGGGLGGLAIQLGLSMFLPQIIGMFTPQSSAQQTAASNTQMDQIMQMAPNPTPVATPNLGGLFGAMQSRIAGQ